MQWVLEGDAVFNRKWNKDARQVIQEKKGGK